MKFKFIDLFAGIGGLRIPFDKLGGECVFTSEIDKKCQDTYEINFKERPFGDIKKITESNLSQIPKHDLLLAGFPCQAFSNAGKRKGFNDTRGTLFYDIEKILAFHKPKAFLLENVKGLRSHDDGETLRIILEVLRGTLGYYVPEPEVLNSKDFGVPQNRQRIYIVGFLEKNNFQYPKPTREPTKVGDILEPGRVPNKYTISDRLWASHKARKQRNKLNGKGFGYSSKKRTDEYTSTLSARYYKDGAEVLIEKTNNSNPRKLTPNEARRLQGFPDWFQVNKSDNEAYKQFGNAVSVPVISSLANEILKHL
tara:strand:+ start:150 stop:1079 length:930 start_codon:yes stop_codon:yes gene_type:complete